jgi:hypothetical protein
MVTDHRAGDAQGFGEICFCEHCLRLPRRRVTRWGLLNDLTPSSLERRLWLAGWVASEVDLACLCLEAYQLVWRSEVLDVRYFGCPGPGRSQLREMAILVGVSEAVVGAQLRIIVEVCCGKAP